MNIHRPVDVSWIAERNPEVANALKFYLQGEISYEEALKLAIGALYNSLTNVEAELKKIYLEEPYLSEETLVRLRKGKFLVEGTFLHKDGSE